MHVGMGACTLVHTCVTANVVLSPRGTEKGALALALAAGALGPRAASPLLGFSVCPQQGAAGVGTVGSCMSGRGSCPPCSGEGAGRRGAERAFPGGDGGTSLPGAAWHGAVPGAGEGCMGCWRCSLAERSLPDGQGASSPAVRPGAGLWPCSLTPRRFPQVNQGNIPGIQSTFLAMDTEEGVEVVWNELLFCDKKAFKAHEVSGSCPHGAEPAGKAPCPASAWRAWICMCPSS